MSTIANSITVVVESFCMGRPQLVSDNQKMSPWLPMYDHKISLKSSTRVLFGNFNQVHGVLFHGY